jgi:hypothetical protein
MVLSGGWEGRERKNRESGDLPINTSNLSEGKALGNFIIDINAYILIHNKSHDYLQILAKKTPI